MVSVLDSQKFRFSHSLEMWDHDPGDTNANVTTPDGGTTEQWFRISDYENFVAAAMSSTLNGAGITLLEIVAADDVLGTNLTVIKDSGAVVGDAVGDWLIEECLASEVAQASADGGFDLQFVAARITMADAADEAVVVYVGNLPLFSQDNLTPEKTIS